MISFLPKNGRKKTAKPLHLETDGNGEDHLVFLAGLGGTTNYWSSGVKPLQKTHKVTLVDLLGFGESPKPWTRYSTEQHVSALHGVLSDLGPITLVGHSLGALITVAYAARYPSQVQRIVLMSLPFFGSKDKAYAYFRVGSVRGGFLFTNIFLTMLTCIFTRRVFGRILPYIIRDLPTDVVRDLVKHTWRSSTSSLWEVVYRNDVSKNFRSLPKEMDVVFIHGDEDVTAPIKAVETIVSIRKDWKLSALNGVDHHPFYRDRETCLKLINGESMDQAPWFNSI